ncbi:MAG TPA: hypothetical protein VN625_00230, partial [Desulfuromonadaceae bacterium]|nr:hypothetical protein [Desulfuromonadaceae bacterium]
QTMIRYNGSNLTASASFTVYVRDSSWLIATTETNEAGGMIAREIGSTNGAEIYEVSGGLSGAGMRMGMIQSGVAPVGEQDSAVVGHLWLMFASQSYWPGLNSDQLIPVYDWHASAGAGGQSQRVSADWELMNGPGSLPEEVRYFPNAIYTITGTNTVGGKFFPAGFIFKQFQGGRLVKQVEVAVTAIRPVCSRALLIPLPGKGTLVIDERFTSGVPNRPPQYQNPVFGQWLPVEESKPLAGITTSNTLRNLARAGISAFPETRSPLQETNAGPPVLALSIRCTNEVVKAGDEIDVEFRITNNGTNDYKYEDRSYDRSGRINEYKLTATNELGAAVPDPRVNDKGFWMGGGFFQYATLKPGESYTKTIPLNRWALVKAAGRYTVVGTYPSEIYSTNYTMVTSDPITVTVLPRTEKEMDDYIGSLTNQIASLTPRQVYPGSPYILPAAELDDLIMKLMFTGSPKIVPTLLNTLYESGHNNFWPIEALRFYVPHTEETKQAIIATATRRGLSDGMQSILSSYNFTNRADLQPLIERSLALDSTNTWRAGALLAQQYADDAYTARLIALATETNSPARDQAIYALAANRTDEGVRALQVLLHDPDLRIGETTRNAIRAAYNSRGIWQGRPLKPEDFDKKYQQPKLIR